MKFFATSLICSLFVVSMCAETTKTATMNKDTKLKRESPISYGGGHGSSGGLSLTYGLPSSGGSSAGHQQISLAPISLDMLTGGGGHGGSIQQGGYILDTSKLTSLLAGHGLNLDTSKLLSSGGGGGGGASHGFNLGSYGGAASGGGSHSAGLISAQALIGAAGGGDHGAGAQSGGATQYGFALAPSAGHGGSGGYSFVGGADKQGPITFGQQHIQQSPPAATYGVPTSTYQIPSGSYGSPIASSFGGQGHSFGSGSFGNLGGSFGSLGGSSHISTGQDAVPSYAAGIKGLGHYTSSSSSSSPFNSLSSHFGQLSLPGAKYGTPLFTSAKSFGSGGFNFGGHQQPSISSYRHTAVPTFGALTSGGSGYKSSASFRPSVFLGASQDGGDLSSYTSGGASSSYSLPSKTYLPASSGSYSYPSSSSSYQFPSSSSHATFASLGSLGGGSSGGSYSFPSSSSSHASLGSLGGGASYAFPSSSSSHVSLGSLGGGSSYAFPSSSSVSSSSSHGSLGSLGGSSGDSYGSGSFDSHNNYNTVDYSSQH